MKTKVENRYPKPLLVLFLIYSLCFLGGAFNHARDIFLGGLFPYDHVPFLFNAFWTSLAVIDPLVPILFMLGRPKHAVALALAVMICDVTINTYFAARYRDRIYDGNLDLQAQTAFLIFVLSTFPIAWQALSSQHRDRHMPRAGAKDG